MLKQYRLRDYRFHLVITVVALTIIGIMVIGSAKESVQSKQILGLVFSLAVMVVVSLIDYSFLLNFSWIFYALNIVLLLSVRFFGKNVNGATRWIDIGFQFQPSELTKILLILFFAQYIMKHKEDISKFVTIIKALILLLIPLFLVYDQPDLSTSIAIAAIFCTMMYIGGLSYKIIVSILGVSIPLVIVFLSLVLQPDQKILNDYQYKRIMAWIQPEKYMNEEGYQQYYSLVAIGSGQLYGKQLNNTNINSVKNGNFISEPQTDFIFAIAGEELGFVGCTVIVGLLVLTVVQCLMIGRNAKDLAGTIICSGVAALIGFQSFINIGVATALLPNTGIPLPFVSYGLTSLVSVYIGIGLVLNVGLQQKKYY